MHPYTNLTCYVASQSVQSRSSGDLEDHIGPLPAVMFMGIARLTRVALSVRPKLVGLGFYRPEIWISPGSDERKPFEPRPDAT